MRQRFDSVRGRDIVLFVFLLAIFMLTPPVLIWWAKPEHPWFLPYLIWGSIIFLIYMIQRRTHNDL